MDDKQFSDRQGLAIPGLGNQKVAPIIGEQGVRNLDDLTRAGLDHAIEVLICRNDVEILRRDAEGIRGYGSAGVKPPSAACSIYGEHIPTNRPRPKAKRPRMAPVSRPPLETRGRNRSTEVPQERKNFPPRSRTGQPRYPTDPARIGRQAAGSTLFRESGREWLERKSW